MSKVKELLREHGLKATHTREIILRAFSKSCDPSNAEQILKKARGSGVDLATVYRTLPLLEKSGLIRRVNAKKDAVYYELNAGHHHHIICLKCEKVFDFKGDKKNYNSLISRALKQVKSFDSIAFHSLDLFGVCRACAERG